MSLFFHLLPCRTAFISQVKTTYWKQDIFLPNFESFYLAPIFNLNYVLWSRSSSVVWKVFLLSSVCVCAAVLAVQEAMGSAGEKSINWGKKQENQKWQQPSGYVDYQPAQKASASVVLFRLWWWMSFPFFCPWKWHVPALARSVLVYIQLPRVNS